MVKRSQSVEAAVSNKRKKSATVASGEAVAVELAPKSKRTVKQGRQVSRKATDKVEEVGSCMDLSAEDLAVKVRQAFANTKKFVGAHVSAQGGPHKAIVNAAALGCTAFALFLRSQRTWKITPFKLEEIALFENALKETGIQRDKILPHGSYLMNIGSPDDATLAKSRDMLLDEVQRCEKLGITMYNFHPGSTCKRISIEECIKRIAACINYIHSKTSTVTIVVENTAGQGGTIGGKLDELKGIIDNVHDKGRIGVCLDTCHAYAAGTTEHIALFSAFSSIRLAGFDIKTKEGYEQFLADFEATIGLKYLKAVHLNDSLKECGSHADRHADIGKGQIGLDMFGWLMNDARFNSIPLILETPGGDYANEMLMLSTLIKKKTK